MNEDGLVIKLNVGLSSSDLPLRSSLNLNPKLVIPLNELKCMEFVGKGEFGSKYFNNWSPSVYTVCFKLCTKVNGKTKILQ